MEDSLLILKCLHCEGTGQVLRGAYDAWGADAWEELCEQCDGTGKIKLPF